MGGFARNVAQTVGAEFARVVAAGPARPLITWYDDATGDRAELSGATLANWVAKTANMLVDGSGLAPGDRAAVLLPPHWQTAAVLFGCWSAGITTNTPGPTSTAGPVDVLFAAAALFTDPRSRALVERWSAGERYALALAPMAAPLRTVPPGFADYVVEVRTFGDRFDASPRSDPEDLLGRTRERAVELGIGGGDRVLVDAGEHDDPLDWLLAPVLSGASVVLCGHLDAGKLADRVAAEKVTRLL